MKDATDLVFWSDSKVGGDENVVDEVGRFDLMDLTLLDGPKQHHHLNLRIIAR